MSSNWSASATSAFGSRASGSEQKRAAEAAYHIHQQREAQVKRAEEAKETKRITEAMNFASTDTYPSLGGPVAPKSMLKPAVSFSKTVATMAAKVKVEEAAAAAKAAAAAAEYKAMHPESGRSRIGKTTHHMPEIEYDDMDGELDGYESQPESEGEFNADLCDTRRRGDRGIW